MTSRTDWYAGGRPSSFGACSPSARMIAGRDAEHEEVHDVRELVHQPQLEQDEPGGEHHRAGGDQRSSMRRRAKKLSHAGGG